MILAFDIGNTFAKWGFLQGGRLVAGGRAVHRGRGLDAALAELHDERRPTRVLAVNVAGAASAAALERWSIARFGIAPETVDASAPHPAVRSEYAAGKLGADRWAAAVGAYLTYGPCLVADLGTAATIDRIDRDGVHRGGYIVPGVDAMRAALALGTDAVQVEDREVAPGAWGLGTAEAVAAGGRRALGALIASVAREHGHHALVLTGGDAERIAPWVGSPLRIDHDLVLRGAVALAEDGR
jgi:type III pantothenate kinase